MLNFELATGAYVDNFRDGLRPDKRYSVSEWADEYRVLTTESSAEAGRWRTDRTPYLREIMDALSADNEYRVVTFMKGAQIGGPLALDTKVLTPKGFKNISDVKVGDFVFDRFGAPAEVIGTSPIFKNEKCFEVIFDDGSLVRCDGRHKWFVERTDLKGHWETQTKTTLGLLGDYKRANRCRYRIKNAAPLATVSREYLIGPYTLGAWLGDGNRNSNRITTHVDDIEEMAALIRSEGHECRIERKPGIGKAGELVIDPVVNAKKCKRGHDLTKPKAITPYGKCAECHRQRSYYGIYGKKNLKRQ